MELADDAATPQPGRVSAAMTVVWELIVRIDWREPEPMSLHLSAETAKAADMGEAWARLVGKPPVWVWVPDFVSRFGTVDEPGHWVCEVGEYDAVVIPRELLP